jgi:hypothetical protein
MLVGCVVVDVRHAGYYDGIGPAPVGWRREIDDGCVFFKPESKPFRDGCVVLNGMHKGDVRLIADFPLHRVEFAGTKVRIVPNDGGAAYEIAIRSVDIPVENTSDFTIEIPSVIVDGVTLPPIVSRLTWTNRSYRTHPPPS